MFLSQFNEGADASTKVEGWDTRIRLAAEVPDPTTQVTFEYNLDAEATDATAGWTFITAAQIFTDGKALAYKVGQLTISRLKADAQATLVTRFDPRAFHAAVLDTGSLPMPVLERKIAAWVAGGGGVAGTARRTAVDARLDPARRALR